MSRILEILIIEDHESYRNYLARSIERLVPGSKITLAENGQAGLNHLQRMGFDFVFLDLDLPYVSGQEILTWLVQNRRGRERCIIISVLASDQLLFDTLRLGAIGYLWKDETEDLDQYLSIFLTQNGSVMSRTMAAKLHDYFRARSPQVTDYHALTRREAQILSYLKDGQTPQMIADELDMAVATVRTHVRNVYAKLGVSSRTELMRLL